jgi:hypothetical protein
VLVGTADNMLRCYDKNVGQLRWVVKLEHTARSRARVRRRAHHRRDQRTAR